MAKIYGEIASSALMTFDKSFSRSNGQPLDSTEIFYSLKAAQDYAATDVAYAGQKIVVIETVDEVTTITHYGIEADNSLKELGAIPVGDGVTVEVVDGKIQLAGLGEHSEGTYQPFLVDGEIEWRVPSATTVEGLDSRLTTAEGDIDAIEAIVGAEAGEGVEASGLVKAVADNTAAITAEKTRAEEAEKANADAIAAVEDVIGEVPEDKTVVGMIADAQEAATYDDTELAARVKAVEDDYLKGQDRTDLEEAIEAAEESAIDRILGYLAEEEVNTSYDTLKEVAAWIESDTTASAELVTRVSNIEKDYLKGADKEALEGEIDALGAYIGDLPEGAASETVIAYIQEVVDGLKIGDYAKASELTALAGRVEAIETKLQGIAEGAQVNVIDSVDEEQFAIDGEKKLSLLNVAMSKVTGLIDALAGKVDKAEGERLMTDIEGEKLEGIEEGAEVNFVKSIDEVQFDVDEDGKLALLDVAIDKVTGLQDALDGKAAKGTTLEAYGITDAYTKTETEGRIQEVLDGLSDTSETAASVAQALETYKTSNNGRVDTIEGKLAGIAEGAQVNVIESVKIGGTVLEITDKSVNIPIATGTVLGAVMSSTAENKISVAADGTMEVNSVNVNKLVQDANSELILDGGSSSK